MFGGIQMYFAQEVKASIEVPYAKAIDLSTML
jgi:hypothetical protein